MRSILKIILPPFLFVTLLHAQKEQNNISPVLNWTATPFSTKTFIENKGQYPALKDNENILFGSYCDGVELFFTKSSVIYRTTTYKAEGGNEMDFDREKEKPEINMVRMNWVGANPDLVISSSHKVSFYYTFPSGKQNGISSDAFEKITYENIYPGIDVEFSFPEGEKGIKYTLIVNAGADLSKVKISYDGVSEIKLNAEGNLNFKSLIGNFSEHAPISNYDGGDEAKINFALSGNEVQFSASEKIANRILIIDPWVTLPFSPTSNSAYDINHDDAGNVYIFGSGGNEQIEKFDSSGNVQWIYLASNFFGLAYADFAVDNRTGSIYAAGWDNPFAVNPLICKINSAGILSGTWTGDWQMNEYWRLAFSPCLNKIIIGGGGTSGFSQVGILDTNLLSLSIMNILSTSNSYHDMSLMTLDVAGSFCYLGTALSSNLNDPTFNNYIIKVPIPSLTPMTYSVPDGFSFQENASVFYTSSNGFNGAANNLNSLFLFDGAVLKRFNKNFGTLTGSVVVSPTSFLSGGLDADACGNIYVGDSYLLKIYDSLLVNTSTISLPGTIYDLQLDPSHNNLYACGNSFVASYTLVNSNAITLSINSFPSSCSHCDGSATASFSSCANFQNVTYSWNTQPVQTTQTATGLCSGNYFVTATTGCGISFSNSVTISGSSTGTFNTCCDATISAGQSVSLSIVPFSSNVNYTWIPSTGLGCTNCPYPIASPSVTTTYYLTQTDSAGCSGTDSVTIYVDVACGDLFLPNAFSPNGDHQNDIYFVRGNCIKSLQFEIYNRWGEMVFSTSDSAKGWDGTWRNEKCETAVFTYFLRATLIDGTEIERQGNISLIN